MRLGHQSEALETPEDGTKAAENFTRRKSARFWDQLENFISITRLPKTKNGSAENAGLSPIDRAHQNGSVIASSAPKTFPRLDHNAQTADGGEISFNLFIRLEPGAEAPCLPTRSTAWDIKYHVVATRCRHDTSGPAGWQTSLASGGKPCLHGGIENCH